MNVNDATSSGLAPSWETLFAKQHELMAKYEPIEQASGLMQTGDVPVNLDDKRGQARLKDFAWRVVEELAEAQEARVNDTPLQKQLADVHEAEELIDALHFMVELMILSGVSPLELQSISSGFSIANRSFAVVVELGKAMNCLKQKPWKQTHQLTDRPRYMALIHNTAQFLIEAIKGRGLSDQDIMDVYERKHQVNQFRQRSQY